MSVLFRCVVHNKKIFKVIIVSDVAVKLKEEGKWVMLLVSLNTNRRLLKIIVCKVNLLEFFYT